MSKITIRGKRKYTSYLYRHLRKEHPSTKKRITLSNSRRKQLPKKFNYMSDYDYALMDI